jgi:ubiquinone biosynthesis protein COQ9
MLLDSIENKQKILTEALKIAKISGFSQENLILACQNSQIETKYLELIFTNGVIDLLYFMQEQSTIKLHEIVNINPLFHDLKISEKISFLLNNYFSYQVNEPIIIKHILQYFRDFHFTQQNFYKTISSASILSKISDDFWKISQDNSTDFSYYSKRATLVAVILKVAIIFANETTNLNNTKQEINKQITRIVLFAKYKYQTKQQVKNIWQNLGNISKEIIFNENNQLKSPKEIFKSLPFIRLFQK